MEVPLLSLMTQRVAALTRRAQKTLLETARQIIFDVSEGEDRNEDLVLGYELKSKGIDAKFRWSLRRITSRDKKRIKIVVISFADEEV